VSDPLWGNVSLLLSFDGADGATTTTDSSSAASSITFGGAAQIDTAQSKFGGSSALFNGGTSDFILAPSSALTLTGDYSIQFWIRLNAGISSSHSGYVFTSYDDASTDGMDVLVQANFDTTAQDVRAHIELDIYDSTGSRAVNITTPTNENLGNRLVPGQWHYVEITRSSNSHYVFIDGSLEASTSVLSRTPSQSDPWIQIGGSNDAYGTIDGHLDDLRITNGAARNISAYTPPTTAHEVGGSTPVDIRSQMPSIIGAPSVEATLSTGVRSLIPRLLGNPSAAIFNDFTSIITDPTEYYVLKIGGNPEIQVPISNWQATIQSDRQAFVQVVIPAAEDYVDVISERQGFNLMSIWRETTINNQKVSVVMCKTRMDDVRIDSGPIRFTMTIRGYSGIADDPAPQKVTLLTGVRTRSQNVGGAIRVRCDIDWLARPGHTVSDGVNTFIAGYINYYVPATGQTYMDIGTRG